MKYVKMMYANQGGHLNDPTPSSKVVKKSKFCKTGDCSISFVFCDIFFELLALKDPLNLVHIP